MACFVSIYGNATPRGRLTFCSYPVAHQCLTRASQSERTKDGDFERVDFRFFKPVEYDRYMEWKAGSKTGSIIVVNADRITERPQKMDVDTSAPVLLPADHSLTVEGGEGTSEFKLVEKT